MLLNSSQLFHFICAKANKNSKRLAALLMLFFAAFQPAFSAITYSCLSIDCGGLCYSFTSPYPSEGNTWDFGDGDTGTGVTVQHCYTNVDTYAGTNNTALVKVYPANHSQQGLSLTHSSCKNGVFIGDPDGSLTDLTGYSVMSGAGFNGSGNTHDVYVYAPVTINKLFAFTATDIFMRPSAGFNQVSPFKFTLQDGTFVGVTSTCDCQWRGLLISGGQFHTNNDVTIKDANIGIFLREGYKLDIQETNFTNNYIGILGQSPNQFITMNLNFSGNTFSSSGTLLDYCEGGFLSDAYPYILSNNTFDNTQGFAGIYLANCSAPNIGSKSNTLNTFRNIANGIILNNSNVGTMSSPGSITGGIVNCRFLNIKHGSYPVTNGGYGINFIAVTQGHFMRQEGTGMYNFSTPSFENCEVGVNGQYPNNGNNAKIVSKDNRMTSMETGYRIVNRFGSVQTDINTNYIESVDYFGNGTLNGNQAAYGIFVIMGTQNATTDIKITDNVVYTDQDLAVASGIRVEKNYLDISTAGSIEVIGNEVSIDDFGSGIASYSTGGIIIKDNEITLNEEAGLPGILLSGGFDNNVLCNEVHGPQPVAFGVKKGIYALLTANPIIQNNYIEDFDQSLGFNFDCGNYADIGCNTFAGDNNYGLLYTPDALTNDQLDKGNIFNCDSDEFEAKSESDPPNSIFKAEFGTAAFPDSWDPSSFFQPSPNPNPSCTDPDCELTAVVFIKSRTDFAIANDTLAVSPGTLSSARMNLYRKLVEHDSLLDLDILMQAFVDGHENGPVGQFYTIRKRLNELIKVPTNLQDEMDDNLDRIQVRLETMDSSLAVLAAVTTWASTYDTLEQRYIALSEDVYDLYGANDLIQDSLQSLRRHLADTISMLNDAVTAVEIYDVNQQKVFDILLSTIGVCDTTVTNAQLDTLESIAAQCPEEGGRAVLEAIFLHHVLTGSDLPINACPEERPSKIQKLKTEARFALSPNPTSGICTVNYRLDKGQVGELSVWNSFGELKAKYSIAGQSKENIKVEDLSSGIYFVQLSVEGKLVEVQKLVKQ